MRDIPGFEGRYAITEDGRVWSHGKSTNNKEGKFLKPVNSHGYFNVSLCKDGEVNICGIHCLVALTYLPNPNNHPVTRHLDNNKHNNHISNLDWCTHRTNIQQAWDDGLKPITEAARQGARKFCIETKSKPIMQLTCKGILCRIYKSCAEAGRITGISRGNISSCATGRKGYTHCGGYIWKFI